MYDTTNITVVGNALNTPEWRRFERTNALVANFKIASTSRRYDKQNGRWIDGDNLRVRVNCWRRLAEGVVASVRVGDPVIVTGRLYTRDWTTEDGQRRSTYELEAATVGHDLSRGVAAFKRGRINVNTTVVEDAETDRHVQGELTAVAPDANARSEALAAGVGEELRATVGSDLPHAGYDSPVNAERIAMEDLDTVVGGELRGNLDRLIADARRTLGTTTFDPADEPAGGDEDEHDGTGVGDEAASLSEDAAGAASGPARPRRSRSRVGANA